MVTVMLRSRHCHCFEREREIEAVEDLFAMEDKLGEGICSIYFSLGTSGVGITWTVSITNKLTNNCVLIHFFARYPVFVHLIPMFVREIISTLKNDTAN